MATKRRARHGGLSYAVLAATLTSCGQAPEPLVVGPRTFQIAYQSAVHGEIEPCG